MVLANCNYSFEVGQGTKVEYNFNNLERQVMDRFLFSKSAIINLNEVRNEKCIQLYFTTIQIVVKNLYDLQRKPIFSNFNFVIH